MIVKFIADNKSNGSLILDKYYVVYSVVLSAQKHSFYFVLDETGVIYPKMYSADLFECVDSRLSRFWEIGTFENNEGKSSTLLAFGEWANDIYFHGKLLEGDKASLDIFDKYKCQMEEEFLDPSIIDAAEPIGDGFWVSDKSYNESWEVNPLNEMTRTPSTSELLVNPKCIEKGI